MNLSVLNKAGIDYKKGLERFQNDEELYSMVLHIFLADKAFSRAKEALMEKNYDKLFDSVHELKGCSGNADMTNLYTASSELVELLRNKSYTEEQLNSIFIKFEDAYNSAQKGIREAEVEK